MVKRLSLAYVSIQLPVVIRSFYCGGLVTKIERGLKDVFPGDTRSQISNISFATRQNYLGVVDCILYTI